jgi:alpha-mannosidase
MKRICNTLSAITLAIWLSMAANAAVPSVASKPDLSTGETLYLVGYAHLDTQWHWDYPTTISQYLPKTMNENFRLFELYPHYIFNFSGANRYRMMKEYYPADYAKVKQYVAAGRWFPCGSSMEECDVNVPSAESIIRQVLYGNDYFRKEFGKDSAEFMLPDCFGFPASLPSLLAHCGLKGFSTQKLTWGSAVGIPFNVGVWEGLDGKSVIAALNPGKYGGSASEDLSKSETWIKRIDEDGKRSGLYADFMYHGRGDSGGSPREPSVQWAEKSVTSNGPVRVIECAAEQMFLDITPEQAAKLPRYKGDLLLTEHSAGAISSQAYMKRWNRKNELLADAAERASVAADWLGGLSYPKTRLNDAWTLVMGGQFHDILPGTSVPKAYEYSWNDEILASNQFADVLERAAGAICSGLDTRTSGVALTVYNPLGIAREDIVEATVAFAGSQPSAVDVVGPDGKETPAQIVDRKPDSLKILFVAKAPSVGFAVYDLRPAKQSKPSATGLSVSTNSIENQRYRLTINADGDVANIYDKALGRELLKQPLRYAFTYDNPQKYPAWNIDWNDASKPPRAYLGGPARVRVVENGPVRVAVAIEREAQGSRFAQIIRLSAGSAGDRIEFADTVDWRSKECNFKAVFPLTASNSKATYNWEVGTIERGNDDPKKYEVPSHQWFDLTDTTGDYGVTVLTDCKYASDKPDDNTLRLTLLRTPGVHAGTSKQAAKAGNAQQTPNVGNRQQSTNDWGRHEILYGLAAHRSDWRGGGTDWQALRMEQPLLAFQCDKHDGEHGKTFSLVRVDNPQIRVIAVKKAESGDEIVVRLVEMQGKPMNSVHIAFAAPVISAREVNGQEQPLGEAIISSGELVASFTPYSLHTFAVKLADPQLHLTTARSQPVPLPYNKSVASRDGQKSTSGFDGQGTCLSAEMLPTSITDNGIVFDLASATNDKPDAVACAGQTIPLPEGQFNKLVLLAASSQGDQPATFTVDGRKVGLTIQNWGGFIGQWDNRQWSATGQERTSGWLYGCSGLTPGYVKRAPVAWFCSHRHTADGANAPYQYTYLYRYSISLPAGAKAVQLPQNDKIIILAASVATDSTDAAHPAQPLYDTLEDHTPATCALKPTGP